MAGQTEILLDTIALSITKSRRSWTANSPWYSASRRRFRPVGISDRTLHRARAREWRGVAAILVD